MTKTIVIVYKSLRSCKAILLQQRYCISTMVTEAKNSLSEVGAFTTSSLGRICKYGKQTHKEIKEKTTSYFRNFYNFPFQQIIYIKKFPSGGCNDLVPIGSEMSSIDWKIGQEYTLKLAIFTTISLKNQYLITITAILQLSFSEDFLGNRNQFTYNHLILEAKFWDNPKY